MRSRVIFNSAGVKFLQEMVILNCKIRTQPEDQTLSRNKAHWWNRKLQREEILMAKNHIKLCLTFVSIREMKIKLILEFHPTPISMDIVIWSTNEDRCWHGCGNRQALIGCWWGTNKDFHIENQPGGFPKS